MKQEDGENITSTYVM